MRDGDGRRAGQLRAAAPEVGEHGIEQLQALAGRHLHAVRGKYVGRGLAEFQYRFNRRCDLAALPLRLAGAAAASLPLPYPLLTAERLPF